MIQIIISKKFKKAFKKRIAFNSFLVKKYKNRLELFVKNPQNPILRDHLLKGEKSLFRAFSITGDVRVIYYMRKEIYIFIDIGTHNQVY